MSLQDLLEKAVEDKTGDGWEAVKLKLQELENEPKNDEYFGDLFEIVVPPDILERLIPVIRKSDGEMPPILQKICSEFDNFTFEHVRVAFEGSTEKEILEMYVYGEDERYERNESALMLLMDGYRSLDNLKSAHLLATKYPSLMHVESFGDCAGDHFQGTLHPMSQFPMLVEAVLGKTKDDDLAIGYIRDYWFPVHSTWCNELGVADSTCDRFVRMVFDLINGEANELLEFVCEKKMWDIPAEETTKAWKGILKSGILGESETVLESVAPMLGVTPECVVFAQEMKRSTNAINVLIKHNPGVVKVEEPSKKRAKTGNSD